MASVTFTPGAAQVTAAYLGWQDRDAPVGLVDASVLSPNTDPRYVQRVRLWRDARDSRVYLNAKATTPDGTNAFGSGDDLSDAWEASATAITIAAPNGSLVILGVGHPDAVNAVAVEPYQWDLPDNAVLDAWIASYVLLSSGDQAAVTITLDDGVPPEQLAMSARAGNPTAAFNLRAIPPVSPEQLAMAARAGNPTAAFNLRAIPPVSPEQLAMSARAGNPTAAFNLRAIPPVSPEQLAMSARAGNPTAAFNLRAISRVGPPATRLPIFPIYTSVEAMDLASRQAIGAIDLSKATADWWDPDACPEEALGAMLAFLGVGPLDTDIFGTRFRRLLMRANAILRRYRGSDFVLDQFRDTVGITYSYVLTRDSNLAPTGIEFTIAPPLGLVPGTDWQSYLRKAFRWLLPPSLDLNDFTVSLIFDTQVYAHSAFKLRHRIN